MPRSWNTTGRSPAGFVSHKIPPHPARGLGRKAFYLYLKVEDRQREDTACCTITDDWDRPNLSLHPLHLFFILLNLSLYPFFRMLLLRQRLLRRMFARSPRPLSVLWIRVSKVLRASSALTIMQRESAARDAKSDEVLDKIDILDCWTWLPNYVGTEPVS